jgi:GNAT superfamily N-acetyltransferase
MNRFKSAWRDLAWSARRRGPVRAARSAVRSALDAISRVVYSHEIAIVHCAELASWPDFEPQAGLTIRPGCAADLDRLEDDLPPSRICKFHARFDQGQLVFIAEVDGDVAGYAWMCTQSDSRAAREHGLNLGPGEGLHWDSRTLERYRRQGVYTALQRFSRGYMKARGYVRVYGGANIRNPAPLRMMKNLGLQPVHVYHMRRILGRKRRWVEPIPPGFSV